MTGFPAMLMSGNFMRLVMNVKFRGTDAGSHAAGHGSSIAVKMEFRKLLLHPLEIHTEIQQSAYKHVAADPRGRLNE
jgi:hypothetical protein